MNTLLMPCAFFTGRLVSDPFRELRKDESFDGCIDAIDFLPKGSVSAYPIDDGDFYPSQIIMRQGAVL